MSNKRAEFDRNSVFAWFAPFFTNQGIYLHPLIIQNLKSKIE